MISPEEQSEIPVAKISEGSPEDGKITSSNDKTLTRDGVALERSVLGLRGHARALVMVQRGAGRYNVTVPLI